MVWIFVMMFDFGRPHQLTLKNLIAVSQVHPTQPTQAGTFCYACVYDQYSKRTVYCIQMIKFTTSGRSKGKWIRSQQPDIWCINIYFQSDIWGHVHFDFFLFICSLSTVPSPHFTFLSGSDFFNFSVTVGLRCSNNMHKYNTVQYVAFTNLLE